MKPTNEEYMLLYVVSFLMVADSDIDFSESFWTVLGNIIGEIGISLILATILYYIVLKPIYTWMRKN